MSDLEQLRGLGDQLRPPPFDSLVATARRRTRRTAALAAACTAVVLVIGGGALRAGGDDRSAPNPAIAPTRSTQSSGPSLDGRTFSPEAGEVQALPQGRSYSATMRSGRYELRLTPTLDYEVDVPDQWTVVSGRFLNDGSEAIFFVAPAPASSTGLPLHPCRDHTTRVVGPTVSDLAEGLRRQPLLDVTKPVPVSLDGHRGLYLEVTIPDGIDAESCVDDRVSLFESGGPDGYAWQEGYVGRWWILEVDGQRMVVMPQCDTGCTDDDFATLTTMAQSITFTQDE
jgi:hypothetical protein